MNDLQRILAALSALSRRERRLAVFRAVGVFAALVLLIWLGAVVAAGAGLDRSSTRWMVIPALLLVFGASVWWVSFHWSAAGLLEYQARNVARAAPELRGLVQVLAEKPSGPEQDQSTAIHQLLVDNVSAGLRRLDVSSVHPHRLWGASGGLLLSLLVFGVGSTLAPMGAMETLAWLAGGSPVPQLDALEDLDAQLPPVRVGDVSLRYEYPAYTGLSPLTVDNSNGEVHGPPGTLVFVSGRTEDRFDSVLIQSYDLPPVASEMEEDRGFEGRFVILDDGTWRAVFQRGAETLSSASFPIVLEPDDPPIASLSAEARVLDVDLDTPFTLTWSARDDFGLSHVELVNGSKPIRMLVQPTFASREERGELTVTAAELGLRAGSDNVIRVSALDNDGVLIPKPGLSGPVRIRVLGDAEEERREVRYRKELRDALVLVLAPFSLDEHPLGDTPQDLGAWARPAAERFEPLNTLVDSNWQGDDLRTLEGRVIEEVQAEGSSLLRFVMELSVQDGELDPQDQLALDEQHENLLAILETYVLMLDRIVRAQGMGLLDAELEGLIDDTRRGERMASYEERESLKEQIAEIKADIDALEELALTLDSGAISGMVSQSVGDLRQLIAAAEKARGADDLERSAELLGWSADELERLQANLASWRGGLEAMSEGESKELKELIEELERLEAGERELLGQTQAVREMNGAGDAQLSRTWLEVERLARSSLGRTGAVAAKPGPRSDYEDRVLQRSQAAAERLLDSVSARDLRGARVSADASSRAIQDAAIGMRFYDGDPSNVAELDSAGDEAQQVRRLLDAMDLATVSRDPVLTGKLEKLLPKQETLSADAKAVQPRAAKIAKELPMGAPGLEENLDAAVREMGRAERALESGRPFAAEGAEEAAADRLELAIRSLEQAAAAQSQMQREMGSGEPSDSEASEGEGGEDWNEDYDAQMELPEPERDVDIARYRQQLMQGMEGEVPEEYEALKRRY
ncbi:MAG: hypothetical protein ACI9VR_004658, partial [Cognaticolwellia sp.]